MRGVPPPPAKAENNPGSLASGENGRRPPSPPAVPGRDAAGAQTDPACGLTDDCGDLSNSQGLLSGEENAQYQRGFVRIDVPALARLLIAVGKTPAIDVDPRRHDPGVTGQVEERRAQSPKEFLL